MKKITILVPDNTEGLGVYAIFNKSEYSKTSLTYCLDVKEYDTFACIEGLGIHPVEDCTGEDQNA